MGQYELLYIIPAIYTEAEIENLSQKIAEIVVAGGGLVSRQENLGKIKLAYPIKHQKYGQYILLQFQAEPTVIGQLNADLRLRENVLRQTISRSSENALKKTPKLEAYVSPLTEEGTIRRREFARKPVHVPPGKPKVSISLPFKAPAAALSKPEREMSMEELDKKLDEILSGAGENL